MKPANPSELLRVGTCVKIRDSGYGVARIAEYRGPFGRDGVRIYRVLVQKNPEPVYIEVREDQLEVVEDTEGVRSTG